VKVRSAFVSLTGILIILCGISDSLLHAQTWSQYGPEPRFSHTGVFDPSSKQMIIFGGQDPSTNTDLNDSWLVTTSIFRQITATSMTPTGTAPAPRYGHVAVYDSNSNHMTIFGGGLGLPSPCANDVWVLDGANGKSGTPAWIPISPSGTPPAGRIHSAAVYDPTTNAMIIFGGNNCSTSYSSDVWVLSNANGGGGTPAWTKLAPSGTPPSVRESSSAIYDSTNNVMTIFGGDENGADFGDVWTLSNANGTGCTPVWTQLSPTGTAPLARTGHSAVYDSVNNRMIVYGGFHLFHTLSDTWVLTFPNGIGGTPAWTQILPTGTAPTLGYHSAVYDASANAMYVFSGSSSAAKLAGDDHAFVLSNANGIGSSVWNRGGPPARYSQSVFYDSVSNGMFVFGGQHATTSTNFDDYWELNPAIGSNNLHWIPVAVIGTLPAPRWGHTGLYDTGSKRMMLFGGGEGFPAPCVNDYWVMTGANNVVGAKPTWTSPATSGTPPAVRTRHAGVYDPVSNAMIVFGGNNCASTYYSDVWVLHNANAVSGTLTWTKLSPTGTGPSARQSSSATYNSTTNTMTIYGGDTGGAPFGDIWILSHANGTGGTPVWHEITPTNNGPVARSGHSATYDLADNLMTVYGGWDGTNLLADSWVLSGADGKGTATWTQILTLDPAPARRFHSAIYGATQNQINIFGGLDSLNPLEPDDHTFSLTDANGEIKK